MWSQFHPFHLVLARPRAPLRVNNQILGLELELWSVKDKV